MGKKSKHKLNKKQTLKKFSKGGFSKKEIKKFSKKFNVSSKRATKLTTNYTKKNKPKSTKKSSFKAKPKYPVINPFAPNITSPFYRQPQASNLPPPPKPKAPKPTTPKPTTPKPTTPKPTAPKPTNPSANPYTKKKTPTPPTVPPANPYTPPKPASNIGDPLKIDTPTDDGMDQAWLDEFSKLGKDIESNLSNNYDTQMDTLRSQFNTSTATYQSNIDDLNTTIGNYQNKLSGYDTKFEDMAKRFRNEQLAAAKFRGGEKTNLNANSAGGVRLRRSKRFKSGDFAQGTSRFNRRNFGIQSKGINL